jgi:hypothetical protein
MTMTSEDILVYTILGFIIFSVLFTIISYEIARTSYKSRYCNSLDKQYSDYGKVSTIDPDNVNYKGFYLRDYYIKTAYNCCALGQFTNTYVSTCMLTNVIKQGVRCLDFEIYSVNNEPVIAVSASDSYYMKEAYNSLPFDVILNTINENAFSTGNCPNPGDPLILHFRIKSNNDAIYNKMADNIKNILQPTNRLLGREFSYENYGTNLGATIISDLMGKIIIIVDKTNTTFEKTPLEEFINLASNSVFMRALRNYNIEYTQNYKELITFNKKNMTLSMPDLSNSNENVKALLHANYGCQMIGMCYQNYDENLKYYEKMFSTAGHSFVLKPSKLRYKPVLINKPTLQTKNVSYAPRVKETDYYKMTL